ncbi:MAG: penicillin acylase family protein [Ignavibacteriae bacterium]|nr:penicillin acylase family protein [Ignavibacteriota bacterium]
MRLSIKVLLGFCITFAVVFVAALLLSYYLVTKSFPDEDGAVALQGVESEVHVYRDEYGMPHIYALSENDAWFAVGYLHAQDRLWQLEIIRRAGMGRLAEILGEPALNVDRMFRTIGLPHLAHQLTEELDDQTRQQLDAYAKGINAYIQSNQGRYPVEFDVLSFDPEPWRVEHSVVVSRLMAWELNHARWVDVLLSELVERFGEQKAREIFPEWDEDAPFIIPEVPTGRRIAQSLLPLLNADKTYRALTGAPGFHGGSNGWVVSGAKSVTGKPILANDPHLVLTAPARWYEAHISAPGIEVSGATIPGVPFVVIGRNRYIAWGVTNAMADDEDFYIEAVDSLQHPTGYRFEGTWKPMTQRIDTILVKDGNPVLLTVYQTHRGPIVNRFEPVAQYAEQLISMRWAGKEVSNEAKAFYMINKATNWREFKEGLKHFAVPAQNFVYADVEGNIGYRTGGILPIRRTKGATLPYQGMTDEHDWKGYVPFERMPESYNPDEEYIATANNKIIPDTYPYHISHHWEPPWRAMRINEVLRSQEKFSAEDFQRLQADVTSPHAREIVPLILDAYVEYDTLDSEVGAALTILRNWDFRMNTDDVATSVFQSFFVNVIQLTFEDEMGPELLALYDTLASVPLTVTTRLLKEGSSAWFDNVFTPEHETRDDIIRMSFEKALNDLKGSLGGELKEWRWGRLHKVEFGHVFGDVSILRSIFNVGPFQIPGAHSTVWKGDYRLARPFVNHVGPSTRQIFDLADANNTRAVTPPGQSGQVYHNHYKDQVQLWLEGGYRHVPMDRELIEQSSKNHMVLQPAQ